MTGRGPILDDLASLMTNAAGMAQGVRREAQVALQSRFERWLADRDVPSRDELEAVRAMARRAREENESLAARVCELEAKLAALAPAGDDESQSPTEPPSDPAMDAGEIEAAGADDDASSEDDPEPEDGPEPPTSTPSA